MQETDAEKKLATWPREVVIYTDGASRGNPGAASIGVFVTGPSGETVLEYKECVGHQTNNYAEYTAVLRSLELAKEHGTSVVTIRSDSELMVRQMQGQYKVKSPVIIPLFQSCKALIPEFKKVEFEHVRREYNREADRLANEALDAV